MPVTFECDNLAGWVHDGRVCGDWSADGVGSVTQVNDDHLSCVPHLLSNTNELVTLHSEGAEPNVGCVDAHILKLQRAGGNFDI